MRAVGSSLPRVDAAAKVTGTARFPGDIDIPGQAWMKILFAGFVHGRITAVDTAAAEAAPGVLAILTAKDVPVNEYGLIMPDQPVLCGVGSTPAGGNRALGGGSCRRRGRGDRSAGASRRQADQGEL